MKARAGKVLLKGSYATDHPALQQFYARQRLIRKLESKSWKHTANMTGNPFMVIAAPERVVIRDFRVPARWADIAHTYAKRVYAARQAIGKYAEADRFGITEASREIWELEKQIKHAERKVNEYASLIISAIMGSRYKAQPLPSEQTTKQAFHTGIDEPNGFMAAADVRNMGYAAPPVKSGKSLSPDANRLAGRAVRRKNEYMACLAEALDPTFKGRGLFTKMLQCRSYLLSELTLLATNI